MRNRFGAAVVFLFSAGAFAQTPPLTLVAYSGQQVPGAPPNVQFWQGGMDSIIVGGNGDVAFLATVGGYQGTYVWRGGVLSPLAVIDQPMPGPGGTTVSGQMMAVPIAMNGHGDVLVNAMAEIDSNVYPAVWTLGPSGNALRFLGGDPLPGVNGRAFAGWNLDGPSFPIVRRMTDDRAFAFVATVAPASIGQETINRAAFFSTPGGAEFRASAGVSGAHFTTSASVSGFNDEGDVLVYGVRVGRPQPQHCLADEDGVHELLPPGVPAPGFPGANISSHGAGAVGAGGLCAVTATMTPSTPTAAALWLGTPGDMQPVLTEQQVLTPTAGQPLQVRMLALQSSHRLFVTEDGAVLATVQLTPMQGGTGGPSLGIVRCKPGEPPRVVFDSREGPRNIPGATFSPFAQTVYAVPGVERIAFTTNLFQPGQPTRTALVTQDEHGAPYAVIVGGSVANGPGVVTKMLPMNLNFFGGQFGPLVSMTDSGHIAVRHQFTDNSTGVITASVVPPPCGDLDFNNDGLYPDNTDLTDFLAVFGGADCPTHRCDTIDFNRDGLFPDNADISALFSVFGGGPCE